MTRLELKVPPDLVALVLAGLMWLVSPSPSVPAAYRVACATALLCGGLGLIVAARVAFARVNTTFSPVAPNRSSQLVTTGVYRLSRNPMYLGTLLVLLALAVWLSGPVCALVALCYAGYVDWLQIRPEERVLRRRFGSEYEDYTRKARRWF